MSFNPDFIIVPFEVLQDDRLTLRHIRVLMSILSWRKKNTNVSAISREMIAERTGYPLPRISTITSELEALGWIKKQGNGGRSKWIRYEISDVNLEEAKPLKGSQNSNGLRKEKRVTKTETVTEMETVTDSDLNGYQNGNERVTKTGTRIDTERITDKDTDKKTNKKSSVENVDVCVVENEEASKAVENHPTAKPKAAITTYCRSEGIDAVPNLKLDTVMANGAKMIHFVEAVGIAKERSISRWGYVLGIVENLLAEAAKPPVVNQTQARSRGGFDPLAYVNRNRIRPGDDDVIDV